MDGQKISTQPFAHKLHPIVSHLTIFSSGFLSIYGFLSCLSFCASKEFKGVFLFGESKKYQHMNRLRFLYSLHLFIIQNRFKNNVNTLLLVGCCFSFTLALAFCCRWYFIEIDTEKIDPENIWYHSIEFAALSLNLFVFIFIYGLLSGSRWSTVEISFRMETVQWMLELGK